MGQKNISFMILEITIATAGLLAFTRLLYVSKGMPFIGSYYATIFAALFIYVPVMIMWWRRRPLDFLDRSPTIFLRGILYFIIVSLIVFPPYLLCAHFWMLFVYGREGFALASFPDLTKTVIFQILLIALPEEFFFRGYMQGTLDKVFSKRWRVFGTTLGWSWVLTAIIFAFSHSFVSYQWWHFSIFFPALVFGWLRERTGSITAPVLFHAMYNIISDWVMRSYF